MSFYFKFLISIIVVAQLAACGGSSPQSDSSVLPTYTLSYSVGLNGQLIGNSSQKVIKGNDGSSIRAVANNGYYFTKWSDNQTDNPRIDSNAQGDINVIAEFIQNALPTYTLNYSAGLNGQLIGNPSQKVIKGNDGSSIRAVANNGYHFTKWSDNQTDNPRIDSNAQGDINVAAEFIQNQAVPTSILYISWDGTGDYNTDGVSDQVEINAALDRVSTDEKYNTVHLKGPHTYWIDSTILLSSHTILEGENGVIVKLVDDARWPKFKPLMGQKDRSLSQDYLTGTRYQDITIRNFEVNGNANNQTGYPAGASYYSLIFFQNTIKITINDMYLANNLNDGILITSPGFTSIDSHIFNNRISSTGHDGIYVLWSSDFDVHDNIITGHRTDAGIRVENGNNFSIYNNTIGNNPDRSYSGGAAIQIESKGDPALTYADISHNYLFGGSYYHGVWLNRTNYSNDLISTRGVKIHHNIISSYRKSAIYIRQFNNTLIENNVIEGNTVRNDGIGAGVEFGTYPSNTIKGFETVVRNNIILNNPTYGIDNSSSDDHTFISEYNDIYGNGEVYNNVSSITDIYSRPDFVGTFKDDVYPILSAAWGKARDYWDKNMDDKFYRGDMGTGKAKQFYHLKSTYGRWNGQSWVADTISSLCIDAGSQGTSYANEPAYNGSRVNIGAFGNTAEASKSPSN